MPISLSFFHFLLLRSSFITGTLLSCQLYVQCLANSQSKLLTSAQRQSLLYGHKNWHWSNLPWLHFNSRVVSDEDGGKGVGKDNWGWFGGMVKCESSLSEWQNQSQLYHLLSSYKMCRSCECFPPPFFYPFLFSALLHLPICVLPNK